MNEVEFLRQRIDELVNEREELRAVRGKLQKRVRELVRSRDLWRMRARGRWHKS
jgi:hypothetical protein